MAAVCSLKAHACAPGGNECRGDDEQEGVPRELQRERDALPPGDGTLSIIHHPLEFCKKELDACEYI